MSSNLSQLNALLLDDCFLSKGINYWGPKFDKILTISASRFPYDLIPEEIKKAALMFAITTYLRSNIYCLDDIVVLGQDSMTLVKTTSWKSLDFLDEQPRAFIIQLLHMYILSALDDDSLSILVSIQNERKWKT